jgi:S-adenosylmethionine synthetase
MKSIEFAVVLSREMTDEKDREETSSRCMQRIMESVSLKELNENLKYMINHMGVKIFSFQGKCHASVLRRAERYIWDNPKQCS